MYRLQCFRSWWREQHHPDRQHLLFGRLWSASLRQFRQQGRYPSLLAPIQGGDQAMDKASEAILALKPVSFHYKKEIEPNGAIMFGLVAEDVEKVDPDLVTRNDKGEPETVRYDAVNAMLLNEFLKEHRKVEEQGRTMEEQDRTIAQHDAEIRALASQLQRVSAEIEVNRQARQMISGNE